MASVEKLMGEQRQRRRVDVNWSKPQRGWAVLNTDSYVILSQGSAAVGGVIRDDEGRMLGAFTANLGDVSIMYAELAGILQGVRMAKETGVRKLIARTDSRAAVQLLAEPRDSHPYASIIHAIRRLLMEEWEVKIEHVYREANYMADAIAGLGHGFPHGIHVLSSLTPSLHYWLMYDLMGVSSERYINP